MKAWMKRDDGTWEEMPLPARLQSSVERHCERVGWVASETDPGAPQDDPAQETEQTPRKPKGSK